MSPSLVKESENLNTLEIYPQLLRTLLANRGITNFTDSQNFLEPNYENHLHDPYLLKDIEKAVERILKAVQNSEKILIYSDYDADGIPGGVVLREFFEKIGHSNIENYIPDRHEEGFGVHKKAVETFGHEGVKLLITVDCGTADVEPINRAVELGIDVIITDHHEPNGKVPKACAIINPKQKDCQYPFKELCGSGVVYKLIQAILLKNRFGIKEGHEKWALDLVGMATLSDMVPLVGENRALAHYGLKVIKKSARPGLQKLFSKIRINQSEITEDDITFSVSPRLNAASRMGHPIDTFKLLFTKDYSEADVLSDYLNKINDERKGAVAVIVREIHDHLKKRENTPSVVVLGDPEWKPALLGLVASRIQDEIKKPIFLWGRNGEDAIKGSCRSDGVVNLIELMEEAREVFTQFGGHKFAGGFSVSNEKIHFLEEELNSAYKNLNPEGSPWESEVKGNPRDSNVGLVDATLTLNDVNWETYSQIEKLAPFGIGNPKPTFLFENISPTEIRQFGKEKTHLELVFFAQDGQEISAISFFSKPERFEKKPEIGKPIDLIATFEKSNFRNYPELRLRIVDII